MFTAAQLLEAYSRVKSGADYPRYVQDLKQLGVTGYDCIVADGRNVFYGAADYSVAMPPKYDKMSVAAGSSREALQQALTIHQQGQTDYPTFCRQAAEAGVEKWHCDLQKMEVAYLDQHGTVLLAEQIPAV